jgi:hypothetical protein
MYVAPEGVAGTNINQVSQAGAQQRYAPQPVPQTPAQQSQQLAAQKLQQLQQPAAQQIAPAGTSAPAPIPQPAVRAPVPKVQAQPVVQGTTRPSNAINKELTDLDNQMTNLRDDALRSKLKPDTPEGQAYSNQLNELSKQADTLKKELEAAQKAEKQMSKKKAPSNVSQMIVPKEQLPSGISSLSKDAVGEIYPTKDAYDKAMIFKTLQEDVPRASYIEGGKLITVFPQNIPKDIIRSAGISPMGTIIRDAKTGKVIKD